MAISFDYSNAFPFIKQHEVNYFSKFVNVAHRMLHEKEGPGSDYLGWVYLPLQYDREEFARSRDLIETVLSVKKPRVNE